MTGEVLVVGGRVRGLRRSPAIARWVVHLGREVTDLAFRIVDLDELGLALDDEPALPALGRYTRESTRTWSDQVTAAAGLVIVTPQYNWSIPAPLKNAIDHLYREWKSKPALLVTYGGHGGDKCEADLRKVMTAVGARLVDGSPGLKLPRARIEADDGEVDPATDFAAHAEDVRTAMRALAALIAEPAPQPAN